MKFHEVFTHYAYFRGLGQKISYQEFYARVVPMSAAAGWNLESNNLGAEFNWYQDKRPYYNIWPGIIPLFTSLKLDIDGSLIRPLPGSIAFRFPVDNPPLSFEAEGQTWPIKTIIASPCSVLDQAGFALIIDTGEGQTDGSPVMTIRNFQAIKGQTIEEGINCLPRLESDNWGVQMPLDIALNCIKIVCGVCLLHQGDSDLIQANVLNKDALKYAKTGDQKYVNKAHRRGKLSWDIGKAIERAPHFRRAHLAIYWTGPGRKVPIIKLRGADKPIIVHRDKVEGLPTDFLDKEQP